MDTITKATGKFRGDTGTGYIVLTLTPNSASPSALTQAGHFSMTFLSVAPPASA